MCFIGKNYLSDFLFEAVLIFFSESPYHFDAISEHFIEKNFADMPVVSLDAIRKKLKIDPTDAQGEVIAVAQEKAKEYLRKKQPFVWNATNLTAQTRGKQIDLFERYDARVRTIFLETEWTENLTRNSSRLNPVPTVEIEKMLSKLETPEVKECQAVEWLITSGNS